MPGTPAGERTMLDPPHDHIAGANPRTWSVLLAVGRRLWPTLLEATLIPTALCYAGLTLGGLRFGIGAAGVWMYFAIARRLAMRRPLPGLLVLAAVGVTIRLGLYAINDNAFVYFVQPIARTIAVAVLFAGSAVLGRPLVGRFAGDFCSFTPEVAARPAVAALFQRLTWLWAGAQGVTAAANMTLLLTVPASVFVGTAAATAWLIMGAGIFMTVTDSVRTTRGDGLVTAITPHGHLQAMMSEPTRGAAMSNGFSGDAHRLIAAAPRSLQVGPVCQLVDRRSTVASTYTSVPRPSAADAVHNAFRASGKRW
jgi:hypothetical protein